MIVNEGGGGKKLPTLTNPGTVTDMMAGKQLIGQDGEIVTGRLPVMVSQSTGYSPTADSVSLVGAPSTTTTWICMNWNVPMDMILREGGNFRLERVSTDFGNATAADVTTGKTFTSAAGVKVTGTGLLAQTLTAQITGPYMDTFEMVGPGGLVQRHRQAILEQTPIIVPGSVIFISILANSGQRYIPSSNPGFSDAYWVDNITDNLGYQMSYGAFIAQYGQTTYQINFAQR